jgi:hypothetical protein
MKNRIVPFLIIVMAGIVISCSSFQESPGIRDGQLSARTFNLVQNAVFEVVLEKPPEESVIYESELDWTLVPFAIRNDKYYSIGTAFAISNIELITAFHVIDLGFQSIIFDKYYIRDSQGNVYEIDQITGGSNEKDFLIFTVKGKTFDDYFQFENNYKPGDAVFSIGNALGEGIVVRNGLILGTVPEADSGRWDLLKSSADGNPGNSGGPLVTSDGKVVAVVIALRENILYSVPSDVILNDQRTILPFRVKFTFGHLILANNYNNTFETEVSLPLNYIGVRQSIREAYLKNYDASMSALFDEAPEYLTGSNSAFLLNSSLGSIFPEVSFVDRNDNNWKLSNFERRAYTLEDDGRLLHTAVSGINFYKLKKPTSVSVEKSNTDPKYIMDIILNAIRTTRSLWGSGNYRILSYGEPASTSNFYDSFGRMWISAHWVLNFSDEVFIMYILPLPNGPAIITTIQNSALLYDYKWNIQKLCDHLFVSYDGSFSEWNDFIKNKNFIPKFLEDLRFEWNSRQSYFSFSSKPFSISADRQVFDWTDSSELFIAPTWYKQNDTLEFGVRKIILNGDQRGNEFFVLYRNIKPEARLGSAAMENWNDLVIRKFPFDEKPVISARENTGSIGAIIKASQPVPDVIHSLYLAVDNPQNEENITQRFDALKEGITIIK